MGKLNRELIFLFLTMTGIFMLGFSADRGISGNKPYELLTMSDVRYLFLYDDINKAKNVFDEKTFVFVRDGYLKIKKFADKNNRLIFSYFSLVEKTPLKDSYFFYPRKDFLSNKEYEKVLKAEFKIRDRIQEFLNLNPAITVAYLTRKNTICFFEKRFPDNEELKKYRLTGRGETVCSYNAEKYYSCYFENNLPRLNCPRAIIVFRKEKSKTTHFSITLPVFYGRQCLCLISFGFDVNFKIESEGI